ncbi:MAG: hypothetical protein R3E95_18870 [Thiolinea sp.]
MAGDVDWTVLGVYALQRRPPHASGGMVSVPRTLYERYWPERSRSSLGIKLRDPAPQLDSVRQQLQEWAKTLRVDEQPLVVRSIRPSVSILQIFDRTFAVTHVLRSTGNYCGLCWSVQCLAGLVSGARARVGILRAIGFTQQLGGWCWGRPC